MIRDGRDRTARKEREKKEYCVFVAPTWKDSAGV